MVSASVHSETVTGEVSVIGTNIALGPRPVRPRVDQPPVDDRAVRTGHGDERFSGGVGDPHRFARGEPVPTDTTSTRGSVHNGSTRTSSRLPGSGSGPNATCSGDRYSAGLV